MIVNFASNDIYITKTEGISLSVVVYGNFGGGTLSISGSHDGVNFVEFEDGSLTTPTAKVLSWSGNVRFELTGSTNPNLNISLKAVRH